MAAFPPFLALVLWLLAIPSAVAAPPLPAALLLGLERDLGGALAQLEATRETAVAPPGGEVPAKLLGIADGSAASGLAVLDAAVAAVRRRLYALDLAVQELGDPQLEQILFIMNRELDRLVTALAEAKKVREGPRRYRALDRVERALLQLDGAIAALWTFD